MSPVSIESASRTFLATAMERLDLDQQMIIRMPNRQRYCWCRGQVSEELEATLKQAWHEVRQLAADENISYREASYFIAVERVKSAITMQGF